MTLFLVGGIVFLLVILWVTFLAWPNNAKPPEHEHDYERVGQYEIECRPSKFTIEPKKWQEIYYKYICRKCGNIKDVYLNSTGL